jgi:predicted XRE-type DNA-binding protein
VEFKGNERIFLLILNEVYRIMDDRSGSRHASDVAGNHQSEAMERSQDGALRVQLATRLNGLIAEKNLTQTAAAAIFGIPQPHVSELRHFKLSRFSAERLMRFITLLDRDVEIVIRPKDGHQAQGSVLVQLAV